MAGKHSLIKQHVARILAETSLDQLEARLRPKSGAAVKFPAGSHMDARSLERRWDVLARPDLRHVLCGHSDFAWAERNVENGIGAVTLPLGVAGPLRVNGVFASGDYWIPLATSEAALVASYHRGCRLLTAAGGCTSVLLSEAISRSPAFVFKGVAEAGKFVAWITSQWEELCAAAARRTQHGKLVDMAVTVEGNTVWLNLEFTTGDASGQNMVTLCSEEICAHVIAHSPVAPRRHYVEGNMSGDKKASALAFTSVRGKKVCAEARVTTALLHEYLRATPEMLEDYWRVSALAGVQSGTLGVQGHFANGLAALYIATGQDAACVAESAVGVTHFERCEEGLYASVTLPAVMVGTVGGGTGLPSQAACLDLMGLRGPGHSQALAEICAALMLAGELSIIAALATGNFTRAHAVLARGHQSRKS